MTNPANDIVKQASQGSVAAIIQVLNEKLADSGVRTRAMLDDHGVLQLLCEAPTAEQLEPSLLIDQIRQILEGLAPRNLKRININSRIVREQQLLWLEEISRDPAGQLLWSQEITLNRPNFLQQIQKDWQSNKERLTSSTLSVRSPRQLREQRQFWRGGLVGGISVAVLLLAGWALYSKLISTPTEQIQARTTQPENSSVNSISTAAKPTVDAANGSEKSVSKSDPFASAVRLAEQASQEGQTASSQDDWRKLAQRWQEASDLMSSVPSSDRRYAVAQDRVNLYRQYSQSALQKAEQPQ